MKLIEVVDLYKSFGDVRAVNGISFAVEEGTIFGFLGPNGAGKTTTIRILVTLSEQTSGTAIVGGVDVSADPRGVRSRVGYAAQATGIDRDLTGRENLILQGRLHGLSKVDASTEAEAILEVISLAEVADRRAGTYSGGMAKRLDLAQALIHRPNVLFLDEPTTGLDPQNRNAMWTYLRKLNDDGMTIFLTTQYLEEADELADDLAIIDNGRIVVEGSPTELKRGIGGDSVTLMPSTDSSAEDLEVMATAMRALHDTNGVEKLGDSVVVYLEDGGSRIAEIVRAIDTTGVQLGRLELAEPSLDQVFLKHTGARLRVEDVKPPSRMSRNRRHR
ncbi:MAG TPA: ATP-binding cassette domain-containing protein [Actinobacteria bacterium]|nr:daunorubicin/doxorubicin resistance ATP-binding protein DrrA [bacterium BMS3Bbin02]HDL42184.1 ATP-binding cassette domain-containing protein [Actinomycetota bacterium]